MRNVFLSRRTTADISTRVEEVLRSLGNFEPPLCLDRVREVLGLRRGYFHLPPAEVGRGAGWRPSHPAVSAAHKLDLQAVYLADRRAILINAAAPAIKQRWNEAHEIGHALLDWHYELLLGDDEQTLSPACHARIEAEAMYAAGRLLFLGDRLGRTFRDEPPGIRSVLSIARRFGNGTFTTVWRIVEDADAPMFGMLSVHPVLGGEYPLHTGPCRYFIRSRSFAERFGGINESDVLAAARSYCLSIRQGPLGGAEVVLHDDGQALNRFVCETFHNGYDAVTIGTAQESADFVAPAAGGVEQFTGRLVEERLPQRPHGR
jgi:hypothetical protein